MVAEKNSAGRRVIYNGSVLKDQNGQKGTNNGSVLKDQNEQKTDKARAKRI
jgi:hypothetical protein